MAAFIIEATFFPSIEIFAMKLDADAEFVLRAFLDAVTSALGGRYEVVLVREYEGGDPRTRYADPELPEARGAATFFKVDDLAEKRKASFVVECHTKRSSAFALLYLDRS